MADNEKGNPFRSASDRVKDRERKRHAVLATAVGMFNERGFNATSLEEVATKLGVTKPAIYHYFGSKEQILFHCFWVGKEQLDQSLSAAQNHPGSAFDRLMTFLHGYATVITGDFGMCLVRTQDEDLTLEAAQEFRALKAEIDKSFRQQIREASDEGWIEVADVRLAAFTLAGALSWIPRWYRPGGEYDLQYIIDGIVNLLFSGMATEKARK